MTKEQLKKLGISVEKDDLTQEEIDALVEKRVAELTGENSKLHNSISKTNSEIAEYKRKEQEKLSEEEKRQLHEQELETKIAGYERQIARQNKINEYLGIGYPKELAEKVADCEIDGKSSVKYHAEFVKSQIETAKAEQMKNNPNPNGAGSSDTMTLDKFKKLKPSELAKFAEEHPTEFDNLASQVK